MILAWALAAVIGAQAQGQFPTLVDKPGKLTLAKVCFTCHGPENVLKKRRTKAAWDKVIDDMSEKGAKATDAQFDEILTYLSRYYVLINVNQAKAEELVDALDIAKEDAAAIVHYREANGDFKTVDAIAKVPGVDAAKLDARKDRIVVK